jgi:hypothetical protein
MVELVAQEQIDNKTILRFKDFRSICPFTNVADVATVELDYVMRQGQMPIASERLQAYLASFGSTEIAMEMIPVDILKFCIDESLRERPPTGWKHAAPDEVTIRYKLSEGKGWGMTASVSFSREVK